MKTRHVVATLVATLGLSSTALAERPSFHFHRVPVQLERAPREVQPTIRQERTAPPVREVRPATPAERPARVEPQRERPHPTDAKPVGEVKDDRAACHPGSPGCGARADEGRPAAATATEGKVPAIVQRLFAILNAWKARAREE